MFKPHGASLKENLKPFPVAGMQQERGHATHLLVRPGFECEGGEPVLAVKHTQLAVCSGFDVDVVARFQRVAGGVRQAVVPVLPRFIIRPMTFAPMRSIAFELPVTPL